jgi:hypothetical protein
MKGKEILKESIKAIGNLFQKEKEKRKEKKDSKNNIREEKVPSSNLKALSTLLYAFSNLFV